jgi:hypothetical protein
MLVPLTVTGFNSITSFSLRLEYDTTNLNYISFANANPQLSGISVTEEHVGGPVNKLTIRWNGASPQTIASGGKLLDLNLYYGSGTTPLNFNNTANYGIDCEFTDQNRSPLFDNPTATYYFNGQVSIDTTIQPTITGPVSLCHHAAADSYATESGMNNYSWSLSPGGSFVGQTDTNVVQVQWNRRGSHTIQVNYTTPAGCSAPDPTSLTVQVDSLPYPSGPITGPATLCVGDSALVYSVDSISYASTYLWTLPPGATIVAGENTRAITVSFSNDAESGNFQVYGNNLCGNGTASPLYFVTITQPPYPPYIEQQGDSLVSTIYNGNQWYNLSGPIAGATGKYFAPQVNDYYYDIVTQNGCSSAASNIVYFVLTSLPEPEGSTVRIFPNPAGNMLNLKFRLEHSTHISAILVNTLGKESARYDFGFLPAGPESLMLDLSPLGNGLYMLHVDGIDPKGQPIRQKVVIRR